MCRTVEVKGRFVIVGAEKSNDVIFKQPKMHTKMVIALTFIGSRPRSGSQKHKSHYLGSSLHSPSQEGLMVSKGQWMKKSAPCPLSDPREERAFCLPKPVY